MQTTFHPLFRTGGALTALTLALATAPLTAADKSDAFPAFENHIKISAQAPSITGDEQAFQARTQQSRSGGAGIEELHLVKELDKDSSLTIDGRALSQSEDYLLGFKYVRNEMGTFDFGYKRFRTFYDGVGGFFPTSKSFMALSKRDLHVDRGNLWAEIKVALPNSPEFKLKYTNGTRNGKKDSLSWGDSDNSGQTYRLLNGDLPGANSNATVRKNMPSYFDVDERHETLEGVVKHTIGKTKAQLTLLGERSSKNNFHWVSRFPGETLGVLPGSSVIVAPISQVSPASQWMSFNNQVNQETYDIQDTKTKAAIFTTVTELSSKLTLDADVKYEYVAATFSGDRKTVSNSPIASELTRQLVAFPVLNLDGHSNVEEWAAKVAFDYKASEDFSTKLAMRYVTESAYGKSTFDVVTASAANPPVIATTSRIQNAIVDEHSWIPVLELHYTGLKDLALYATVSDKVGNGTDDQTPAYNPLTTTFTSTIYRNTKENNIDFTVGGNWRATSAVSARGELFYKNHSFAATGWNTNTNAPTAPTLDNNYELDGQFYGVKLTAVVKPMDVLSFTTRYIYQKGKRQVTGFKALYPSYDSMDMTTHNLGVSLDWNPNKQFYMQANANVVFDIIKTAALHDLSVAASGTIPVGRFLKPSENNYETASLLAGTVLTKTDDLQLQYTYYKADNYNAGLALYTQPYGASAKESSISVNLKHMFSDRCIGNAKFGYYDSKNDTTGGNTNFKGPMAYVSLDYAL